jgi:anti-sigma factor RsiW
MASLAEQLDVESLLLMYLADELAEEDRAQVDRRLAADVTMVDKLARLRDLHESCAQTLKAADAATALPMSSDTAVRRVSRAMKQWQVDRLTKKADIIRPRRSFHLPWWTYGSAIAAAIIVGVLVWSSNLADPSEDPSVIAMKSKQQDDLAEQLMMGFRDGIEAERTPMLAQELSLSYESDMDEVLLSPDSGSNNQ